MNSCLIKSGTCKFFLLKLKIELRFVCFFLLRFFIKLSEKMNLNLFRIWNQLIDLKNVYNMSLLITIAFLALAFAFGVSVKFATDLQYKPTD